jgi:hypothetical protein
MIEIAFFLLGFISSYIINYCFLQEMKKTLSALEVEYLKFVNHLSSLKKNI